MTAPAGLIGRNVRVLLRASELVVFDGRREVARHARSVSKGSQTLVLDHYLEVLARKPGALPGAVALDQARAVGVFTPAHEAFWAAARRERGDAAGTRELVEVLLLHRHLPHAVVTAGLSAAVAVGATTADVVAVEARKRADRPTSTPPAPLPSEPARVVSLTQRRLTDSAAVIGGLPADERPLPSVAQYDELLKLRHQPHHQPCHQPPTGGPPPSTGRVS